MGPSWTLKGASLLLAVARGALAATIALPSATSNSVTTITSSYASTVTNTLTNVIPLTTTTTTCTLGTAGPASPANSAWSSSGLYWKEQAQTVSLQGTVWTTLVNANSIQECYTICLVFRTQCVGMDYFPNLNQCRLLSSITGTVAIDSTSFAAIQVYSTNPCVATTTETSIQLTTETTVTEVTTTYTSTITTSTPTATSSTVATPTASTCTVSALPSTTECVDGYYAYDGDYYQVLCNDDVESYSGFLPNSRQDDIWRCIEVCSTYSNCIGTFWFYGTCYSESGTLDYDYVPIDESDPDNNLNYYIAKRLTDNPCPVSSSSAAPTSSRAVSTPVIRPSSTRLSSSSVVVIPSPLSRSSTPVVRSSTPAIAPSSTPVVKSSSLRRTRTSSLPIPSSRVSPPAQSFTRVPISIPQRSSSAPVSSVPARSSSRPAGLSTVIAPSLSSPSISTPVSLQSQSTQSSILTGSTVTSTHGASISSSSSGTPVQLTTSTITSTEVRTVTTCPPSVPNCPVSQRTTYVTTETVTIGTTICPVTATEITMPQMTTSTFYTTEVRTVTACPPWVPNCPASQKTTYYTTETVPAYTTVCPVTASETGVAATPTAVTPNGGNPGRPGERFTTSTVYTTEVHTMTACPPWVPNCPASQRTTSYITETVPAYTTVCPVTASETGVAAVPTTVNHKGGSPGHSDEGFTTSTVYTTQVHTVTACPPWVKDCPASEKTTHYTTETIAAYTTVCPITATVTDISVTAKTLTGGQGGLTGRPGEADTASTIYAVSPAATRVPVGGENGENGVSTITSVFYTTEILTMTAVFDQTAANGSPVAKETRTLSITTSLPVITTLYITETLTMTAAFEGQSPSVSTWPSLPNAGANAYGQEHASNSSVPSASALIPVSSLLSSAYVASGTVQTSLSSWAAVPTQASGTSAAAEAVYTGSAAKNMGWTLSSIVAVMLISICLL